MGQCIDMYNRECYQCFCTNEQKKITWSGFDLGERRNPPLADEIYTFRTGNAANTCVMKHNSGEIFGLSITDAEKLMGLPDDWTNPPGTNIPLHLRFKFLGLAVAVPQSKWIGERLLKPHDLKFNRCEQGIPFNVKNMGEDGTEAWPQAAWNILSQNDNMLLWSTRKHLKINAFPLIKPFYPLGEFGLSADQPVSESKIQIYHNSLTDEAKNKMELCQVNTINKKLLPTNEYHFESESDSETEVATIAPKKRGRPPKTPPTDATQKKKGRPPKTPIDAIQKKRGRPPKTPPIDATPKKRGRPPKTPPIDATPKKRGRPPKTPDSAPRTPVNFDSRTSITEMNSEIQHSMSSSLTQIESPVNSDCGLCKICKMNARIFKQPSNREKRKCAEAAYENAALKKCPMVNILAKARAGNRGAELTLLREKAEGKRIQIYFVDDQVFYPATLSNFDQSNYTFKLKHDDGFDDTDSYKLWTQTIRTIPDEY
tara:strand:- start:328 stop:1779 length:1452 start_codon:yes stop_codon:yes gene_type:complete